MSLLPFLPASPIYFLSVLLIVSIGFGSIVLRTSGSISRITLALAGQTSSHSVGMPRSVFGREFVSIYAMGLSTLVIASSFKINGLRDRFQMIWIAASPIPAKVVKLKSNRNRSTHYFINESVENSRFALPPDNTVSPVLIQACYRAASPIPTTRFRVYLNFCLYTFRKFHAGTLAVS